MSIRPVKATVQARPEQEGAGIKLHRGFLDLVRPMKRIPSCSSMTFATRIRRIIWPVSPGIRTEVSKPLRMCWQG